MPSDTATPSFLSGLLPLLQQWIGRLLARSERMLAITFALLILVGTILLRLPVSHTLHDFSLLDALFTATSAVCVTGLSVVDIGTAYTPFGQAVILLLIQLGGLGIMTFAALAAQVLGSRLSLRSQAALADSLYQARSATQIGRNVKWIVLMTFSFEALGAAILLAAQSDRVDAHHPAFAAVFHAVSAFCNAGFSLHPDNLIRYRAEPVFLCTIMLLIVVGGLGHSVVLETLTRWGRWLLRRPRSPLMWSLHSRVVWWMSGALIVLGALLLMFLGVGRERRDGAGGLLDALFQSVTCRTAGFNSVDIAGLPRTALLVMILLMFIGGSPSSCAGGIKTTSLATWYAQLGAWLRGRQDVTLLGRRLAPDIVARAAMIIGLAVVWVGAGCLILAHLEPADDVTHFTALFFEQVSAFGTVGLSTGITPNLSVGSKIWIILSMFAGRIGPLALAVVVSHRGSARVRFPEERLMIG